MTKTDPVKSQNEVTARGRAGKPNHKKEKEKKKWLAEKVWKHTTGRTE